MAESEEKFVPDYETSACGIIEDEHEAEEGEISDREDLSAPVENFKITVSKEEQLEHREITSTNQAFDSDPESPYPPNMRPINDSLYTPMSSEEKSWQELGEDKLKCRVAECEGEIFTRMASFRRHWAHKHKKHVMVYSCPECSFQSVTPWDVKRHAQTKHRWEDSQVQGTWLKSQRMKNKKFLDPGVFESPPKTTKKKNIPNNDTTIPKTDIATIMPPPRQSSLPYNSGKASAPKRPAPPHIFSLPQNIKKPKMENPNYAGSSQEKISWLMKAGEAKKKKEEYAQEETLCRLEYYAFDTKQFKKKYEQLVEILNLERKKREDAEKKVEELQAALKSKEEQLKVFSNPKLLAIAELLK